MVRTKSTIVIFGYKGDGQMDMIHWPARQMKGSLRFTDDSRQVFAQPDHFGFIQ